MDEQEIADKLKQNIPITPDPVAPAEASVLTDEQSSASNDAVNELSLLKIGSLLGLEYPRGEAVEKLAYIHDQLKGDSYEKTLENVNAKLLELGLKFSPDKFLKLWLWLRLNQERQAIDNEIGKI